jgi:hypothetical protein
LRGWPVGACHAGVTGYHALSDVMTGQGHGRDADIRRGTSIEITRCSLVGDTSGQLNEAIMATQQDRQIVETPTEARQAEAGPSVLALMVVSTGLAVLILGILWFVFFRT